jgi:hypothetical protein
MHAILDFCEEPSIPVVKNKLELSLVLVPVPHIK